jgi:hypothetical protein
MPTDIEQIVIDKIKNHGKISAVKAYKDLTGKDLKESKEKVDEIAKKYNVQHEGKNNGGCAGVLAIAAIIFLTLITAVSCSESGSNKDKKGTVTDDFSNYLALKERATQISSGSDTTFLQFRFGMSPDEVNERLQVLEKDSTVQYDYTQKQYAYDVNTGRTGSLSRIHCLIVPEYYKNQLYSILLLAGDDRLASTLMVSVLAEKYGSEAIKYKVVDNAEDTYVWFVNHVQIKVNNTGVGGALSYTDLKREMELKADEAQKNERDKSKTQSQL